MDRYDTQLSGQELDWLMGARCSTPHWNKAYFLTHRDGDRVYLHHDAHSRSAHGWFNNWEMVVSWLVTMDLKVELYAD